MQVNLISYSKPARTARQNIAGLRSVQDLIAYCARVSNPSNQLNMETSEKLIKSFLSAMLILPRICSL
jgi:hypothetical protein